MDDDRSHTITTALAPWLADRLVGVERVTVSGIGAPKSGYSAETIVVDTEVVRRADQAATEQRFVVRIESPDPAVYPVQAPGLDIEIEVQWRAMSAVSTHSTVPIAPLIGYEPDPSVIGAPFFVMGHVDGEVPIESPIYTTEGFFFDAAPADRRRMVSNGLGVLAQVHGIDLDLAGLEWLDVAGEPPGSERQLRLWHEYAQRELDGRTHPVLDRGFAWLHDNVPATSPVGVSWGDGRLGNIIWRELEPVCVTDFEAVSLAPPEHDLGWWLLFDRWSHEAMDAPRLDGEPTRDEQREIYYEALGRDLGDSTWHEVFAAARYSAIVVRVMNRMVDRGQMPVEATYWLENHAVACLDMLLPD